MVSTSQGFRKCGIGRNLTGAACLKAKNLGYESVILQASSLGEPVYKKLGFVTQCTLGRYEVMNDLSQNFAFNKAYVYNRYIIYEMELLRGVIDEE